MLCKQGSNRLSPGAEHGLPAHAMLFTMLVHVVHVMQVRPAAKCPPVRHDTLFARSRSYLQRPVRYGLAARRQGWAWARGAHSVNRLESLGGSASTVASTRTRQRSAAQRTAGAASPAGISDCAAARAC